jgi:hypothetical protein
MSEYIFGVTNGKITKAEGRRRDKIARQHGGTFIGPVSIPGNSATGWFAIPNKGEPFNGRTANAIMAACNL